MAATIEGYVQTKHGKVWYQSAGDGPALLLLHGGPGGDSQYLRPLMQLADDGFRVVRYDQLGSNKSDKPDDPSLWRVDRFVDEVETVRQTLGLGRMHLLGQSWGSFLALEYALHHADKLKSMVLYSGAASTRQCVDGMNSLRAQLPPDTIAVLDAYEATGETDHPEYLAAIQILYSRHLITLDPMPEDCALSMEAIAPPVYNTMWGPNEFTCTGNLLEWDRRDRLAEIDVRTLIVCGRHDEVIPECSETMHSGIAGSELKIFEHSSHLAHFEEPDAFMATLRGFLAKAESNA